jgi:transposase InsO family protein
VLGSGVPTVVVSGEQAPDADLMERSTVPAGIAVQAHTLSGDTIHHSDAASQYTATHFTDTLMLAGLTPSVGTVGDALDNALAETTIGLYKTAITRNEACMKPGTLHTHPEGIDAARPRPTGH